MTDKLDLDALEAYTKTLPGREYWEVELPIYTIHELIRRARLLDEAVARLRQLNDAWRELEPDEATDAFLTRIDAEVKPVGVKVAPLPDVDDVAEFDEFGRRKRGGGAP